MKRVFICATVLVLLGAPLCPVVIRLPRFDCSLDDLLCICNGWRALETCDDLDLLTRAEHDKDLEDLSCV
jgi:hypothetical protein